MRAARPTGGERGSRTAPRRSRAGSAPRATASSAAPTTGGVGTAVLDAPAEPEAIEPAGEEAAAESPKSWRRRHASARSATRLRAPRHRLLLVCTGVLAIGLFGVLLLNTIISQGAFRQHELEVDLILLSEEEERLARAVQQAESPIEVEKKARKLGMVPAGSPVFLRLSDGAILGEPVPAPAATGKVSFADAPGLQTPKPSASASAEAQDESAADQLIDPALDPATGLDATPEPSPSPSPTTTPVTDAASPGPAPGATPTPTPTGTSQQGAAQ